MRIEKCWFCSANKYPGRGLVYVRSDCKTFNFCRSKCYRLFLKRLNPRKIKWTKTSRVFRQKEIVDDKIHKLERKVDVPIKYTRELLMETVSVLPKILELRKAKEAMYIHGRILSAQEESKKHQLAFIKKHERLIGNVENEDVVKQVKKQKEVEFN